MTSALPGLDKPSLVGLHTSYVGRTPSLLILRLRYVLTVAALSVNGAAERWRQSVAKEGGASARPGSETARTTCSVSVKPSTDGSRAGYRGSHEACARRDREGHRAG